MVQQGTRPSQHQPKFQAGDMARIGGLHRRRPAYYPWLRTGRLVKIQAIVGKTPAGHLIYRIAGSHNRGDCDIPVYDLRHPNERLRAPGGGRRPTTD
jgi:hypothetical protein